MKLHKWLVLLDGPAGFSCWVVGYIGEATRQRQIDRIEKFQLLSSRLYWWSTKGVHLSNWLMRFSCWVVGYIGEADFIREIAEFCQGFSCWVVGYIGEASGESPLRRFQRSFSCWVVGYIGEARKTQWLNSSEIKFQLLSSRLYWWSLLGVNLMSIVVKFQLLSSRLYWWSSFCV